MSWVVDNANTWYVLLGIVAIGFGAAFWLHRRPKYLLGVAAAVGLIALVWLLTRLVVTDRKQLELNVNAMADAVVEGKADVLLKHWAKDFEFQNQKGEKLAEAVVLGAKRYKVREIVISSFNVEELTDQTARVYFLVTVHHPGEETFYPLACRGSFIKENRQWKLRDVQFFNPVVNQKQPIPIPVP
jgi:hypothetical protein